MPANAEDVARSIKTRPEEARAGSALVADWMGGMAPAVGDDEDDTEGPSWNTSRSATSAPIPARRMIATVAMR